MAIKKITFTNANVTAQNDADLYYFLQGGTGILKGIKNEVKASNNANRFIFESGYISIYGRLLFVDNNTDITVPLNRTAKGYVVLDINTATNIAELTYTESTNGGYPILIQENLSTGVGHYQFAIAAYSKTSAALTPDQSFKPAYLYPHIEKQQGSTNANKVFMTDASGNFILVDTIPVSAIPATGVSVDTAKNLEKTDGTKIGADEVALKKDFSNVDNTSDKDKPISDATQEALDKIKQEFENHIVECNCTHEVEITGFGEEDCNLAIDDQDVVITKIQGQTRRKSLNLWNGVSTFTNTNNDNTSLGIFKANKNTIYTLSMIITGQRVYCDMGISNGWLEIGNSSLTFNSGDSESIAINIYNSTSTTSTATNIMLNEGSTALPYEPFDDTLVNSKCDFVSTGKNLWDEQWELGAINTSDGSTQNRDGRFRSKNFIAVLPNMTYYFIDNYNGGPIIAYDENQNYIETIGVFHNKKFTTNALTHYIKFYVEGTTYNNDIMLNYGDTALPYEPYIEDTMQCGLELGEYDWHDNVNHITHRKTSIVDINSLDISLNTGSYPTNSFYIANLAGNVKPNGRIKSTKDFERLYVDSSGNVIFITYETYNSAEEIRAYTNDVKLIYETITETTETNILPSGYKVWYKGMQIQKTDTIPYILTKQYGISLASQVLNNVAIDRSQQKQIDLKANSTDVYTKNETYTKSETDNKIDSIIAGETGLINYYTKSETDNKLANKVPITRTVNGKALSTNIILSASEVGARPSDWTPSKTDIGLENVDNTSDSNKNVASAKILKNNEIGSFTLSNGFTSEINFNSNSVYLIYNNTLNFIIITSGLKAQSTVCYNESDLKPLWFKFDNTVIIQKLYLKTLSSNSVITSSYNGTFNYKLLATE